MICDMNKENIFPKLYNLYCDMKNDLNCELSFKNCSFVTFLSTMDKMGYKYTDTKKLIRNYIINIPRIQQKIIEYLIEKHRLMSENPDSPLVFYDETAIHRNIVQNKTLQPLDPNKIQHQKKSIGNGCRFNIIHAMSTDGLIPNCAYILQDTEIDANHFEHWLNHYLIPNLTPKSIVIYDNAPTHSCQFDKVPNNSNNKTNIKEWLEHYIEFEENIKKQELLLLVKNNGIKPKYFVDDILRKSGHFPLRLPPYYCDGNPIENIWKQYKDIVKHNNCSNTTQQFLKLLFDAFDKIIPSQCSKTYRHSIKVFESIYYGKYLEKIEAIRGEHDYCIAESVVAVPDVDYIH